MSTAVYLHGRGLVCGIGADLNQAVSAIRERRIEATPIRLPDDSTRPYFQIPNPTAANWRCRIEQTIDQAIHEAGVAHLIDSPLIIASSCLNIGEIIETGEFPAGYISFAEHIQSHLGWRGTVQLIPVACTAAMQAILLAKNIIEHGMYNDVVILGIELANNVTTGGFASMQLLSHSHSQPLGAQRDGMVLGEAVGAIHLSTKPTRWQIIGAANIVSGADPTGAAPAAVHEVVQRALRHSSLSAKQIDLIKLQATGSPQGDINELDGLAQTFSPMPPLTTFKHLVGHTLGASGMVELILLTACLEQAVAPYYDYECDEGLPHRLHHELPKANHILSIILGFGGEHAAIVVKDCHEAANDV